MQSLDGAAAWCFALLKLLKEEKKGLPELRKFNTLALI